MVIRIVNATVMDPAKASVERDQFVEINNGDIAAVGPMSRAREIDEDIQIIDAMGSYLVPGLIDAHVHLASFADSHDHELQGVKDDTIAESTVRGAFTAHEMLLAGVTTVRDLGCKHAGIFALKKWFSDHPQHGPKTVIAGAGITVTGGTAFNSSADEVDSREEIVRTVRERVKKGVDFIKVFISGGILHPTRISSDGYFSELELQAIVDLAHALGRKVSAHATDSASSRAAVLAGVDSIEHGHEIEPDMLETMAARQTFLVPTLWHYRRVALDGAELGFPSGVVERAKVSADLHAETFLNAVRLGVPIATGTDSGSPRYATGALAAELRYIESLGIEPSEALHWATAGAARCLGLEDNTGVITSGYRADIVGFREPPFESLSHVGKPWLVISGGRVALLDQIGGQIARDR